MKILTIIIAAALVGIGFFINRVLDSSEVLSQKTGTNELKPENDQPLIQTPTPTPKTVKPANLQDNIFNLRYGNSEILASSPKLLSLRSSDDVNTITDWYKQKIISEGMNIKTFVETKTNENVLNKLVGADGKKEIRVEIKKDAGSSIVQIEVSLSPRT